MLIADNERLIQEIIKQMIGRDDWKQELVQEMSRDKQSMDMLTQLIASLGMNTSRKTFLRYYSSKYLFGSGKISGRS